MLAELVLNLITPAPRAIRRHGLVRDAVSLWSRAGRCAAAWAPHYARCHAAVRAAIAGLARRERVVVLGSGLARDIPLNDLIAAFDEVVLVDAVHLPGIRLVAALRKDLRLVTCDLAGVIDHVDGRAGAIINPIPDLLRRFPADLVISANILSQLPLIDALVDDDSGRLGRRLVEDHLAALKMAPCPVLLLSDLDERRIDRSGNVVETIDLLEGVALPPPDQVWDWELAPFGEAARDERLVHRAGAWFAPGSAAARSG